MLEMCFSLDVGSFELCVRNHKGQVNSYTEESGRLHYIHAKLIRNPKVDHGSLRTLTGL